MVEHAEAPDAVGPARAAEPGTPGDSAGPEQVLSPAEARFERTRQAIGLFLGPAAFLALLLFPPAGLSVPAARLAAVVAWVLVWWVSEAVPIPVTALLGPALAVILGVGIAKEMLAPFGDPVIFLFLGGFMIAQAMTVHELDRRVAFAILGLRIVGGRPARILAGFTVLSAGLSMWMSNTATTAMLYPIALGVVAVIGRLLGAQTGARGVARTPYATGLLLCCAYGSSIGGIGTPVGSPPNLIAIGQLGELAGTRVSFVGWMLAATPIMAAMLVFLLLYMRFAFPAPVPRIAGVAQFIADERHRLGPMTRGQRNVIAAFLVAVTLWVVPGLLALLDPDGSGWAGRVSRALPEGVAAVIAASLLFVLPVDWRQRRFTLAWSDAVRIDWGTLLLFGGGLSLGGAMFRTGLADAIGSALTAATGARSSIALTFLFSVFAIYFTEVTSNTATATMLVPLAIAAADAAGVSAVPPALGCALGCSMAFMLPVATPPNAIVYGSGAVSITRMVRTGFWMNIAASLIVPTGTLLMCALLGL